MTKYLEPKFSVSVGGKAYSDGWERIFGKKNEVKEVKEEKKFSCPECEDTGKVMVEDPHHGHALFNPCSCQIRKYELPSKG